MRYGENALSVIDAVKERLEEVRASLPEGVDARRHLRPLGAHRGGDRHAHPRAGRGDAGGQPHHLPLSLARAQRAGAHPHPAHRGAARLHPHVLPGAHRQHHVAGRHHRRRRRHGRCLDHHHREHPQETRGVGGARAARRAARGHHLRDAGGGPFHLLLAAGDHRGVPPRLHAGGHGGAALQAAGLHQDLLDGLRRGAGGDAHSRARGAPHSRPHPQGGGQPAQPLDCGALHPSGALRRAAPARPWSHCRYWR